MIIQIREAGVDALSVRGAPARCCCAAVAHSTRGKNQYIILMIAIVYGNTNKGSRHNVQWTQVHGAFFWHLEVAEFGTTSGT